MLTSVRLRRTGVSQKQFDPFQYLIEKSHLERLGAALWQLIRQIPIPNDKNPWKISSVVVRMVRREDEKVAIRWLETCRQSKLHWQLLHAYLFARSELKIYCITFGTEFSAKNNEPLLFLDFMISVVSCIDCCAADGSICANTGNRRIAIPS